MNACNVTILTLDQLSLLFAKGFVQTRDRALFGVCFYAATRINEACTLLRTDLVQKEKELIIRNKEKEEDRRIKIHPQLEFILEEYLKESLAKPLVDCNPYLFPGRHGKKHINKVSADRILREACENSNLPKIGTDSFRKTALTWMDEAGIPVRQIQAISGHSTLAALEKYLGITYDKDAISTLPNLNLSSSVVVR